MSGSGKLPFTTTLLVPQPASISSRAKPSAKFRGRWIVLLAEVVETNKSSSVAVSQFSHKCSKGESQSFVNVGHG